MTEPAPTDPAAVTETTDPAAQPATVDWEAEAKKWEKRSKDNFAKLKDAEPKLAEYEQLKQQNMTEQQRQAEELSRWQAEAEKWRASSVSSRIEALAAPEFAFPADAVAKLDAAKYLGVDGVVDEAAIRADLAALLEERPNWRRSDAAPPAARPPAPNPAQGTGGTAATDPSSSFASIVQALAKR
jgi:hypothetical protein